MIVLRELFLCNRLRPSLLNLEKIFYSMAVYRLFIVVMVMRSAAVSMQAPLIQMLDLNTQVLIQHLVTTKTAITQLSVQPPIEIKIMR